MDFEMTLEVADENHSMDFGVTETLKGKDGADGKNGKDGENGLSAYEVALNNGFEGTEEEWLESLKGADGKDGENGKDGADGKDSYDDTEVKADISKLKGTILYDNASGTTGTITLSDNISNYEYLGIYSFCLYIDGNNRFGNKTTYQVGTAISAAIGATYAASTSGIVVRAALVQPSGITITWERNVSVWGNQNGFAVEDTPVKITRVVGYNY